MSQNNQNITPPPHSCLNIPSCPCLRPPRISHVHLHSTPNPPKQDLFQAPEAEDAATNAKTSNIKPNVICNLFNESLSEDGSRTVSVLGRFFILGSIIQLFFYAIKSFFPRRKPGVSVIHNTPESSNAPTPATIDGVPSASPKLLPTLGSLTTHKANVDSLAILRADTSMPVTPFTANTNDSNYEDMQLCAQWTKMSKVTDVQERSHTILARATILYNWDGIIPGRETRGFQAKKGMLVDVCSITNNEWIMVHVGGCFHIPRAYVRFDSYGPRRLHIRSS